MDIRLKVSLRIHRRIKNLIFGLPDNKNEFDEMFKFRYRNYLKHNYIEHNITEKDIDEYDYNNKCYYFIAKIDNRIIGCVRLIRDYYLPTEKECFKFMEPQQMKAISRDSRTEISRLIVEQFSKDMSLPRHLVLLGLIKVICDYGEEKKLFGGYSFIKKTLEIKLDRLKFSYHKIKNYKQIYNGTILKKYFNDFKNSVIPIYYFFHEVKIYINKIFNNRLLFSKQSEKDYIFRSIFLWNLYRKFLG